jgi:hypothetical protein
MNAGIRKEAVQFRFREYINQIFGTVRLRWAIKIHFNKDTFAKI